MCPEFLPSEYDNVVFAEERKVAKEGCSRRSAFAAMGELVPLFENDGITADDVWEFFKDEYNVSSRKHFTPEQWQTVAGKLQSAKHDEYSRLQLVKEVETILPGCEVYRIQRFEKETKAVEVYIGAFTGTIRKRCQAHADASGLEVKLVILPQREIEVFYPQDVPF